MKFEMLVGMTLKSAARIDDTEILFTTIDDAVFRLYHEQSWCENVTIDDICGDLEDLVGSPILLAEEVSNSDTARKYDTDESHTWTFYKLSTIKGNVTIRWYGTSKWLL